MEIAQHQCFGPGQRGRQHLSHRLGEPFPVRGLPSGGRQVPVEEEFRPGNEPVRAEGRKPVRRARLALQGGQCVGRQQVKFFLARALVQQPGEGIVAEILQQQQAPRLVRPVDLRRGKTEVPEPRGYRREGPHVLLGRRRVHQHNRLPAAPEPDIAAERGVARQGLAPGLSPAGAGEKGSDGGLPAQRRSSMRAQRASPQAISKAMSSLRSGRKPPRRSGHSTSATPSPSACSSPSSTASSGAASR